jgi:hypothetical protein
MADRAEVTPGRPGPIVGPGNAGQARAPPSTIDRFADAISLDEIAGGGMQPRDFESKRAFRHRRGAAGALWQAGKEWREQHRTVGCGRHITDSAHGVEILCRKDGTGARYRGLHTCGSIWACPVCARKISHQRRTELRQAHAAYTRIGGACYLLTLTFPHEITSVLVDLRDMFAQALQRWMNSRAYKNSFEKWGRVGSVKALEVTWGHHGWHPHVHIVVFALPGMQDDAESMDALRGAWIDALLNRYKTGKRKGQKKGPSLAEPAQLDDMLAHAFDFQAGAYVTEYIAKMGREPAPTSREIDAIKNRWGVHSEATSFLEKDAIRHKDYIGMTQFGLLADSIENPDPAERKVSRNLYVAFVKAFEGKRQLTWSPGLKKGLNIKEIEDEEIARGENQKPEEEFCVRLFADEWRLLLQFDKIDAPYLALHVASKYGADGVNTLLSELKTRAPPGKGGFIELGNSAVEKWAR